jgi:protein O-GlcNAc transferase
MTKPKHRMKRREKSGKGRVPRSPAQPAAAPGARAAFVAKPASGGDFSDTLVGLITAGLEHHQAGNLPGAEENYRKALKIDPAHPHLLHLFGVVHHQKGEQEEAIRLISASLARNPDFADAHSNLGAAFFKLGRTDEAAVHFRRATELNPSMAEAHSNLATIHKDLGRIEEAIASYLAAHKASPQTPKFMKRLADLYLAQERFPQAIDWFGRYLRRVPDDAEVHNNLGYAHERLRDLENAEIHYRRAVELCGDSPEINNNLASVLDRLGRTDEAEIFFSRALSADPAKWQDLANLAGTYANRREMDRALPIYRQLVTAQPDNARLRNDYGVALSLAGRAGEARVEFERAIALDPDFAEACNNLGTNYLVANLRPAAIEQFKKAIKCRPRYVDAHINLCLALLQENRYDEAYMYAQATIHLEDYRPAMFSNPHKVFQALCDFDACEALGDHWANLEQCRAVDYSTSFLEMLVLADDDEKIDRLVDMHRRWGTDMSQRTLRDPLPPLPRRGARETIRIGFVSSDLRSHSVAKFVLPVLEHYNRERFEVFCYSPYAQEGDRVQERIKGLVSAFCIVGDSPYRDFAERIRADEIDVLFELNGFTRDSKIRVMSYRAAPVQIFWLGYPFTTGMPEVDYILLDEICRPTRPDWLTEGVLALPDSWVAFGEFDQVPIDERLPFERNGRITFGTMNNPYKITREMIALWSQAMKQVPDSRFLIVRPECGSLVFCGKIAQEFARNGIGEDRVYLVDNRSHGLNHLTYYDEIDVTLDTFPVTGGTTTCDAVWMGVPVVSLYGNSLHQRMGLSLLTNAGMADLCTDSRDEYVRIAVSLANDADRLSAIRHGTRERLLASPLCQGERFTRNFEVMLEQVAERHGLR